MNKLIIRPSYALMILPKLETNLIKYTPLGNTLFKGGINHQYPAGLKYSEQPYHVENKYVKKLPAYHKY